MPYDISVLLWQMKDVHFPEPGSGFVVYGADFGTLQYPFKMRHFSGTKPLHSPDSDMLDFLVDGVYIHV